MSGLHRPSVDGERPSRYELLARLEAHNAALARRGCERRIIATADEAEALPYANLREIVRLSADEVVNVNRWLAGTP